MFNKYHGYWKEETIVFNNAFMGVVRVDWRRLFLVCLVMFTIGAQAEEALPQSVNDPKENLAVGKLSVQGFLIKN